MKVAQMLPTLSYGDGVGNDAIAIDQLLKRCGYDTKIYAENIDSRISSSIVSPINQLPNLNEDDIIIYHLSTGSELNRRLPYFKARKIIRYHNITPPTFFHGYSTKSENLCARGLKEAEELAPFADYCLADSYFNQLDLIKMGYVCPIDVLPILIPYDSYAQKPSRKIIKKYNDSYTNIIFVGRITPNKKQEDIIESFYYYQKYINSKSRLILVGSYSGMETYYERLKTYANELQIQNCIFTGHISFAEILGYYKIADIFLCMSEHEGFCIPLLEAMLFKIPIIALKSTGVTATLGNGGLLLQDRNPYLVSEAINTVLTTPALKEHILRGQQTQLEKFATSKVESKFIKYLSDFIRGKLT